MPYLPGWHRSNGIEATKRAEEVDVAGFVSLANALTVLRAKG